MVLSGDRAAHNTGFFWHLLKGALPLAVVCFLLWVVGQGRPPRLVAVVPVLALCGMVLWFGWSSVRRNVGTKLFGMLLALYLGFCLGLFVLGMALSLSLALLPLFLIALPYLAWDLLFRVPSQGQAERTRRT